MSHYETAQICRNGHMITSIFKYAELRSAYCPDCGAGTITACEKCSAPIRGHYHVEGVLSLATAKVPAFCHACGASFPWVEARLAAARELADEIDELTPEEREKIKAALPDLIAATPRTELAVTRFKKVMQKASSGTAKAMREILIDVLSEAAKKSIWGV